MLKKFVIKIEKNFHSNNQRTTVGILAGLFGFVSNLILFIAKLLIGVSVNSLSIMADAINSLSDTISSMVTLVGFHYAGKPADEEHPYGHERFEYISGLMIAMMISFIGLQFLQSSIQKIIHPERIHFSTLTFVILFLSIILKLFQAYSYHRFAKSIDSKTLFAAKQDSINDVYTTVVVLLSAGFESLTGWKVDGFTGLLLAIFILINGLKMVRDFVNQLLGNRPKQIEIDRVKERLHHYEGILGYHDLLLHDYGPQKRFASVHVEVDSSWSLSRAHQLIDTIEKEFFSELGIDLVCHLDPVDVTNPDYLEKQKQVRTLVKEINPELHLHDFRILENQIQFDLVIPRKFDQTDEEIIYIIKRKMISELGTYQVEITCDRNYLL